MHIKLVISSNKRFKYCLYCYLYYIYNFKESMILREFFNHLEYKQFKLLLCKFFISKIYMLNNYK